MATAASAVEPARGRLSMPIGKLRPHYDLVVIGSGYGGAVIAARVAEAWGRRKTVCVLERGRELRPGEYPDTLTGAVRELQVDLPSRHLFSPTALYDVRVNPDMNAVVGCGLGGTSLINASVALEPPAKTFEDPAWPTSIQDEARSGSLRRWFRRASEILRPVQYDLKEKLLKVRALERVAHPSEAPFDLAPVTVTFPAGRAGSVQSGPQAGRAQVPCNGCGDCVSGCNYGAKNTLLMNYLPLARSHGAELFTETRVRTLARLHEKWIISFELLGSGRERFGPADLLPSASPELFVTADRVVLAAGALGSTEILLRSRAVSSSETLGYRFSGNGDVLAFAYDTDETINGVGLGRRSPHGHLAPGPCITGKIEVKLPGGRTAVVEDGVIPGALAPLLSGGFAATSFVASGESESRRSLWSRAAGMVRGGPSRTQTFLAMFPDPEYGKLVVQDDRVRIAWPGAGTQSDYRELETWLRTATASLNGTYLPSPFGLVTVHPLGGCVMSDCAQRGVVDHKGQVFSGSADNAVHPGLFVCDASIIPAALGVNPLLTITALAERAAGYVAA